MAADLISLTHTASTPTSNSVHDKPEEKDLIPAILKLRAKILYCPMVSTNVLEARLNWNGSNMILTMYVADVLLATDPDFQKQNVQDFFRLGEFKVKATNPRSSLVKFHRSLDATIISNKSSLPNGITINPDVTHEERNTESLLLQERWCLIQSGVPKAASRSFIYINRRKHGEVVDSMFCLTPQSDNQAHASISHKTAITTNVDIATLMPTDISNPAHASTSHIANCSHYRCWHGHSYADYHFYLLT